MQSGAFATTVALDPSGKALMKRDMELIRKILIEIQSWKDVERRVITIPGFDDVAVFRHVEMLEHAGLLEATRHAPMSGPYPTIMVKDLTMRGHDLAAALLNEDVWSEIKRKFPAAELATLPLSIVQKVGMGLLEQYSKNLFGL